MDLWRLHEFRQDSLHTCCWRRGCALQLERSESARVSAQRPLWAQGPHRCVCTVSFVSARSGSHPTLEQASARLVMGGTLCKYEGDSKEQTQGLSSGSGGSGANSNRLITIALTNIQHWVMQREHTQEPPVLMAEEHGVGEGRLELIGEELCGHDF